MKAYATNWLRKAWRAIRPKESDWSRKWREGREAGSIATCPYAAPEDKLPWLLGREQASREAAVRARRGYAYDIFGNCD